MDVLNALPINWRLMSHPLNWLTVWCMIAIPMLAAHLVYDGLTRGNSEPAGE